MSQERPYEEWGADAPVTAEELAAFDQQYQQTEAVERNASIPDGAYQVEVERAVLKRTKDGEPMLNWQLNVLGPTHAGARIFKNHLFRATTMPFFKADMAAMGIAINGPSEIPAIQDQLIGLRLNIKQVTKGENNNIYINSVIQSPGAPDAVLHPGVQGQAPQAQAKGGAARARAF